MKIANNNPSINLEAYINNKDIKRGKKNGNETEGNSVEVKGDKVVLSSLGREIRDIKKLVDSVPDIREQKICQIKEKIEKGNYNIDSDKITFSLIKESLLNNDF